MRKLASEHSAPVVCEARGRGRNFPLFAAAAGGHLPSVRYLTEDLSAKDAPSGRRGATALFVACANGHLPVAKYLRSWGSDPDRPTVTDDVTPLVIAAAMQHPAVCAWLVECGVDIDAQDREGRFALLVAAAGGSLEMLCVWAGPSGNVNRRERADTGPLSMHSADQRWRIAVAFPERRSYSS